MALNNGAKDDLQLHRINHALCFELRVGLHERRSQCFEDYWENRAVRYQNYSQGLCSLKFNKVISTETVCSDFTIGVHISAKKRG